MTTRLLLLVVILTVFTTSVLAHRDYEHPVGTFQRADGTTIYIVEHYTDGIIGSDPVAVRFRLPDGSDIASTEFASDVAVRPSSSGVEVYQFESTFIPIASRVHRFDGYTLSDATSSPNRFVSPFVHTAHHWLGYVIALLVAGFFVVVWFGARAIPRRGGLATLRVFGFCFAVLAGAFYLLMLLWMAPLSVPVLVILGLISCLLYTALCRVLNRTAVANTAAE